MESSRHPPETTGRPSRASSDVFGVKAQRTARVDTTERGDAAAEQKKGDHHSQDPEVVGRILMPSRSPRTSSSDRQRTRSSCPQGGEELSKCPHRHPNSFPTAPRSGGAPQPRLIVLPCEPDPRPAWKLVRGHQGMDLNSNPRPRLSKVQPAFRQLIAVEAVAGGLGGVRHADRQGARPVTDRPCDPSATSVEWPFAP